MPVLEAAANRREDHARERASRGAHAHASSPTPPVKPELRSIDDTRTILGLKSRTSIYNLVQQGSLDLRKVLGRSLITQASIDRVLAGKS